MFAHSRGNLHHLLPVPGTIDRQLDKHGDPDDHQTTYPESEKAIQPSSAPDASPSRHLMLSMLATSANTDKFKSVGKDFVIGYDLESLLDRRNRRDRNIINPAAANTSHMVMILESAIEALLGPRYLQGPDFANA
jgi:hypothetical protein